jgi:predicted GIY-YIG superfamily endonuclease
MAGGYFGSLEWRAVQRVVPTASVQITSNFMEQRTMKSLSTILAVGAALLASAAAIAQAPAGAPAGSTGQCKDGTYYQGATKQGACRGHQGVKDWYGATSSAAPTASAKPAAAAPAPAVAAKPAMAAAPSGPAPAGATGQCKDGSYYMGATKQGACRGHQGVKDWYGAATAAAPVAAAAPAAAPAPAMKPAPAMAAATSATATPPATAPAQRYTPPATAAPGGGAGQVWVNGTVYHCPNDRWYGKTKTGSYMTEAEAKAKGAHPDHGKACQ